MTVLTIMAMVFSPEIEAMLADVPVIDWDEISRQLKDELLASGFAGCSPDPSVGAATPVRVFAEPARPAGEQAVCYEWPCLEGRNHLRNVEVASKPVFRVSAQQVGELASLGSPWLTFSSQSVAELNRMGVDQAISVHGSIGVATNGAVVYRGTSDTQEHCDYLAGAVLSRVSGELLYVTTHQADSTIVARCVAHMFRHGGTVCGQNVVAGKCALCGDTGVVPPLGMVIHGASAKDYCLCSAGAFREVRDDEEGEIACGASLMGWPDRGGSVTPPVVGTAARVDLTTVGRGGLSVSDLEMLNIPVGGTEVGPTLFPDATAELSSVPVLAVCNVGVTVREPPDYSLVSNAPGPSQVWKVPSGLLFDAVRTDGGIGSASTCVELAASPVLAKLAVMPLAHCRAVDRDLADWVCADVSGRTVCDAENRLFAGPPNFGFGKCYLSTVKRDHVRAVAELLGEWPSFRQLLELEAGRYSFLFLMSAGVVVSKGMGQVSAHVDTVVGRSVRPLFECLVLMASTGACVVPGSLGELLFRSALVAPLCDLKSELLWEDVAVCRVGGLPLDTWLSCMALTPNHRFSDDDLRIVSSSAALLSSVDKKKYRTLEAVGDSVLSLYVAARATEKGLSVEEFQDIRGVATTNSHLSAVYAAVVPRGMVTFAAGVDPGRGRVGAGVLEVWLGLVFMELGFPRACALADSLGVFDMVPLQSFHVIGLWPSDGKVLFGAVMPPGHGKTYRHGKGRLVEASQVYPYKGDGSLGNLKSEARQGLVAWSVYVEAWGAKLRARAVDGDVIMVSDMEVAESAGLCVLGVFVLEDEAWRSNLAGRLESKIGEYEKCVAAALAGARAPVICGSNDSLTVALEVLCGAAAKRREGLRGA